MYRDVVVLTHIENSLMSSSSFEERIGCMRLKRELTSSSKGPNFLFFP
jgi:hypothetical protein